MSFSQSDFIGENTHRLSIVIMDKMNKPPLSSFKSLGQRDKTKFNKLLNEYINTTLQQEDWHQVLINDTNDILNDTLLTGEFKPETYVTNTNFEAELLLSPQHLEWKREKEEQEQTLRIH